MTTAQEYIEGFKKLPPEEKQIVVDFFVSLDEKTFRTAGGALVTEDWILQEAKLCKERADTEEHASADDFCKAHCLE